MPFLRDGIYSKGKENPQIVCEEEMAVWLLVLGDSWQLPSELIGEGRNWRQVSIWKSTKQFRNDPEIVRTWIQMFTVGKKWMGDKWYHPESKKITYRMGVNISKLYIW